MTIRKIAAFGAIAALTLAGCSGTAKTETPKPGSTTSKGTDAPKPEAKEISLWLAGTDTPKDLIKYLQDTFNKETGSTLKVDQVDWKELTPRLQTALGSETQTPAVVEVGNTQAPTYAAVGAFTDLTDKLGEFGGENLGPKGFLEAGSFDGKNYALPYYWGSRFVFYNKKMLADASIEVPKTLGDFNAAIEKLNTKDVSGLWMGGQDWRNAIGWVFANGGDFAKRDGDKWVGQMSTPESIKGLTELQSIAKNGTSAGADITDADLWVPFNEKKAAMIVAPNWARWSITLEADEFGAFPMPGVEGGAAPVFAGGSNIAISAKSPDQELAMSLMKIIFSDEYQTMLAKNGLGPANSTLNNLMGDDEFAKAGIASSEAAKLTPPAEKWAAFEASKNIEEFFARIAQGNDIADEAAKFDAVIEKALN